jgi:hypothetical protein
MVPVKQFITSLPGRLLRRHLDRLQTSLETLGERLRDAVSRVVGEAVADAVREVVRLLISLPTTVPPTHSPSVHREEWERRSWHDPDRRSWDDEDEDLIPDYEEVASTSQRDDLPGPARWSPAMAVGCQAAAWWLRRQTGRFPVLTTMGLGLTAALAAYAAGPLVVAGGAGLLGAALGLMRLVEGVESGAAALAPRTTF